MNPRFCIVLFYLFLSFNGYGASLIFNDNTQNSTENLKKIKNDTAHINTLLQKAKDFNFKNLDSLLVLTKKAQALSIKTNYILGQAKAHYNLGLYYSGKGKQDEAIKHLKLAYEYGEKNKNSDIQLDALGLIAFQYEFKADYANSLIHCLEGIELATKVNNKKSLASFNANIATLYASLDLREQASLYYNRAKNQKLIKNLH